MVQQHFNLQFRCITMVLNLEELTCTVGYQRGYKRGIAHEVEIKLPSSFTTPATQGSPFRKLPRPVVIVQVTARSVELRFVPLLFNVKEGEVCLLYWIL